MRCDSRRGWATDYLLFQRAGQEAYPTFKREAGSILAALRAEASAASKASAPMASAAANQLAASHPADKPSSTRTRLTAMETGRPIAQLAATAIASWAIGLPV